LTTGGSGSGRKESSYKALKSLAKKEGKSADDLLREGVNLVLQRYGKKPIA
jgi:hypothetical protein